MTAQAEGLLFEAGSADSLAAALRALADPAVRSRFGACGRARVENDRNWLANARRIVAVVRELGAVSQTQR
jgi:glycosyltransferase involved in cell wall biosynthesis